MPTTIEWHVFYSHIMGYIVRFSNLRFAGDTDVIEKHEDTLALKPCL